MSRTRDFVDCGTPELAPADIPGTVFLLSASGRLKGAGNHETLARCAHRRDVIDKARQRALKPRGRAWTTLRVVGRAAGGRGEAVSDYSDPAWGSGPAVVEARDLLAAIRARLTPQEASLFDLYAIGLTFREIGTRLGVTPDAAAERWRRLAKRIRTLLES